jgi:hypothetical protein
MVYSGKSMMLLINFLGIFFHFLAEYSSNGSRIFLIGCQKPCPSNLVGFAFLNL